GHLLAIDFNPLDPTGTQGVGLDSGSTRNAAGSTAVAGLRIFKSYPTLAADTSSLPATGVADGRLMHFKVTADANGQVSLARMKFTFATSSATVTNVNVFAYTDAAYSQGVSGVGNSGQLSNSNLSPNGSGQVSLTIQSVGGASSTVQIPAGQTRYF